MGVKFHITSRLTTGVQKGRHESNSIYVGFTKLYLYTKKRIPNRILFTACLNLKYFRFYGTWNFSRNGLRMPSFFLATSMKLCMQLPNNIPLGGFLINPKKYYFLGRFSYVFNHYELASFQRIGVCRPFECFIIKLGQ